MYIFDYTIKDMLSDDVLNPTVINVRRAGDSLDALKGNIKPHILDAVLESSVYSVNVKIIEVPDASGSEGTVTGTMEFTVSADPEIEMLSYCNAGGS